MGEIVTRTYAIPLDGGEIMGIIHNKRRLFGNCYAMDGGYKGWNPYIERHLAIFVNCFLSRAN
jgi:hypothetical protein